MTAINVFETRRLRPLPKCEHCDRSAWAMTPDGVRCERHTLAELEEAIKDNRCDWTPRRLRRWRS